MTDRLDHRSALLTKPDPANPYTVSESERTESDGGHRYNNLINRSRATHPEGTNSFSAYPKRVTDASINTCDDEASIVQVGTSEALEQCRKTMLNLYLILLKVVGWRRFRAQKHDLDQPFHIKVLNVAYPIVFLMVVIASNIIQGITCFVRNQGSSITVQLLNASSPTITCNSGILFQNVLPDVLNIIAYLWGIYLFRFTDPEYLSTLVETVFLSCSEQSKCSQKGLKRTLQIFLVSCFAWILYTFCTNVVRIFSLQLLANNISIMSVSEYSTASSPSPLRYILVITALFGYTIVDLVYISVVINYVTQCQLIVAFIRSITEGVRNKTLSLEEAPKVMFRVQGFLGTLNGHFANMQSLCLIIFSGGVFFSVKDFLYMDHSRSLVVAAGVLNIIQWITISTFPIAQAARLTRQCSKLKSLGLETAARPYIYSDAPQQSLDSFLLFTTSTHYTANLFCFPFYTKYLIISFVALGFAASVITFPISWL